MKLLSIQKSYELLANYGCFAREIWQTVLGEQAASEATASASGCFKNRSRRVSFDEARCSQFPTRRRCNPGCRTTATAAL